MAGLRVGGLAAALAVLAAAPGARAAQSEADEAEEEVAKDEAAVAKAGADACIDEDVKADLFAKRKQRTSRDRLFQQTNRHELTLRTGYYASDTFDGVVYTQQAKIGSVPIYTFGIFAFAYSYHMTEDFAVEATAGITQLTSRGGPELERTFSVLENRPRTQLMFDADLIYSLAHAKMRFGGSITHFDFFLAAGGGVVDSVVSSGIAANGGFGLKFFLGNAFAFRLDLRDHLFRQQLLSEQFLVNDITATIGLSLFLPTRM